MGSKITKVKPGDAVLLSFAFCIKCHNCRFGAPGYCEKFAELNFAGQKDAFRSRKAPDQPIGGSFFGQSSFSKLTRVQETSLVNVSKLVEGDDDLKLLAPLGCGIQVGGLQCFRRTEIVNVVQINRQVQGLSPILLLRPRMTKLR